MASSNMLSFLREELTSLTQMASRDGSHGVLLA